MNTQQSALDSSDCIGRAVIVVQITIILSPSAANTEWISKGIGELSAHFIEYRINWNDNNPQTLFCFKN